MMFLLVCSVFFQKWCRVDDGHHFRMDRFLAEPPEHKICLQQAYDTTKTPKFFYQKQGQLSNTSSNSNKTPQAEPLFQRALHGMEKLRGADDPATLTAANSLALLLEA